MSSDLIEIHVTIARPVSDEFMAKIAEHIAADLREILGKHLARRRPSVYIADIRGPEDDEL